MSDIYRFKDVPAAYGGYRVVVKNGLNVSALELLEDIQKLQAENTELKKQSNKQVRKVLCEIGTEFENDTRIDKKSMPFVRAIVINKIYDYPTPPEGE